MEHLNSNTSTTTLQEKQPNKIGSGQNSHQGSYVNTVAQVVKYGISVPTKISVPKIASREGKSPPVRNPHKRELFASSDQR